MIEQLHIENAALIEKVELEFGPGLNILSGETGAGKTMVIDSINFLMGERTGRDFIRHGADLAEVTGIIRLSESVAEAVGIDTGGELHLYRSINANGKTVCKINGKTVTLGMLKELSAYLADVHGQHEHQSLLNPAKHIVLLDRFCGTAIETLKQQLGESIKSYKECSARLSELAGDKNRDTQLEILRYQKEEIDQARLVPGEEDELMRRRTVLAASEKLVASSVEALGLLYDGESPALDNVFRAKTAAADIARLDEEQQYLAEGLEDVYSQLEELTRSLRRYFANLEHDPRELGELEGRLDLIYNLKRKYGNSVEEIIEFGCGVTEKLEFMENSAGEIQRLTGQKREYTQEILRICGEISALRKEAAIGIKLQIIEELHELGMRRAGFDIVVERKREFSHSGYDRVEFLIAPNPGEGLKPLAKIASGGEMSRVMLALKTVLADADNIETFIFDEIDAGISGRTAQKVAEKLALIGKKHQILCITHLPQIAAMADNHFLIEKRSDSESTVTSVYALDEAGAASELARLLGGAEITEATVRAAEEMRELAAQLKQRQ